MPGIYTHTHPDRACIALLCSYGGPSDADGRAAAGGGAAQAGPSPYSSLEAFLTSRCNQVRGWVGGGLSNGGWVTHNDTRQCLWGQVLCRLRNHNHTLTSLCG